MSLCCFAAFKLELMLQQVQVVVDPGPGRRGNRLPAIDAMGH
jgi:hypothetical protein